MLLEAAHKNDAKAACKRNEHPHWHVVEMLVGELLPNGPLCTEITLIRRWVVLKPFAVPENRIKQNQQRAEGPIHEQQATRSLFMEKRARAEKGEFPKISARILDIPNLQESRLTSSSSSLTSSKNAVRPSSSGSGNYHSSLRRIRSKDQLVPRANPLRDASTTSVNFYPTYHHRSDWGFDNDFVDEADRHLNKYLPVESLSDSSQESPRSQSPSVNYLNYWRSIP